MESRVAMLTQKVIDLKEDFDKHDNNHVVQDSRTNKRLTRIELALATALGGIIVIGWLINHAADKVLLLLAK